MDDSFELLKKRRNSTITSTPFTITIAPSESAESSSPQIPPCLPQIHEADGAKSIFLGNACNNSVDNHQYDDMDYLCLTSSGCEWTDSNSSLISSSSSSSSSLSSFSCPLFLSLGSPETTANSSSLTFPFLPPMNSQLSISTSDTFEGFPFSEPRKRKKPHRNSSSKSHKSSSSSHHHHHNNDQFDFYHSHKHARRSPLLSSKDLVHNRSNPDPSVELDPHGYPRIPDAVFESIGSRLRRDSLVTDLQVGVAWTKGRREAMEDVHKVIPFSARRSPLSRSTSAGNCDQCDSNSNDIFTNQQGDRDTPSPINTPPLSPSSAAPPSLPLPKCDRPPCLQLASPSSAISPMDTSDECGSAPPITQIEENRDYAFFGVYDGHGGRQAADFVAKNLHTNIVENPRFTTDTEAAIREGFAKTESDFESECTREKIHGGVGTTACIVLIFDGILWVANAGDSAAILCRNSMPWLLTSPHTPKNPQERERVTHLGGIIRDERLAHPVWNSRLVHIGVTRAIGDFYFKQTQWTEGKLSGLIASPDIRRIPLTDADEFLLLASDGFWDVISSKTALDYIQQTGVQDLDSVCQNLVDLAVQHASSDNTTVLLIKLKEVQEFQQ